MTRPIRVGFLARSNPYDRRSFSGTLFYMLRALVATPGLEITVIGPHRRRLPGILEKIRKRLSPPGPFSEAHFADLDVDVVVDIVSSGLVNQFKPVIKAPIFFVTDATPGFLRDFYGHRIRPEQIESDRNAITASRMVVYSSEYMMNLALEEFDCLARSKACFIPFGINLEHQPTTVPIKPPLDRLELLFIGRDWRRKGGQTAVAAADSLLAEGRDVRLTVIGPRAADVPEHRAVEYLGFLDKNKPQERARLAAALDRAHVFLLPTQADCTPMVVAEANAHGCPVLVTEIGGIPSLMAPGRNGAMLPPGADGNAYAAAVRAITGDADSYRRLSESSFAHCHARLTWKAWAEEMKARMKQVLQS